MTRVAAPEDAQVRGYLIEVRRSELRRAVPADDERLAVVLGVDDDAALGASYGDVGLHDWNEARSVLVGRGPSEPVAPDYRDAIERLPERPANEALEGSVEIAPIIEGIVEAIGAGVRHGRSQHEAGPEQGAAVASLPAR